MAFTPVFANDRPYLSYKPIIASIEFLLCYRMTNTDKLQILQLRIGQPSLLFSVPEFILRSAQLLINFVVRQIDP